MAETKRFPSNIRLWNENAKKMQPLVDLGINCSELVNELVRDNLDKTIKKKIDDLKKVLERV